MQGCFINGRWVETADKLSVLSPWSGEVVGEVCLAGVPEWDAAIIAAQQAAKVLRGFSSRERRDLLEAMAAGVKARQEELAQTIVAEGGKPITYARGEMARGGGDLVPGRGRSGPPGRRSHPPGRAGRH